MARAKTHSRDLLAGRHACFHHIQKNIGNSLSNNLYTKHKINTQILGYLLGWLVAKLAPIYSHTYSPAWIFYIESDLGLARLSIFTNTYVSYQNISHNEFSLFRSRFRQWGHFQHIVINTVRATYSSHLTRSR